MGLGDISQDQVGKLFEALALDKFLDDREVAEAMDGPEPELSKEEEAILAGIGSGLPGRIRQWRAEEEGCVIPIKEERDEI